MPGRPDHALLYDSDCGFCKRSLERVMRRDREGRLHAVAIQSEEGQQLLAPVPPERRLDSWHLIRPDGEVISAGQAAAPLLRLLPRWRRLAPLLETFSGLTDRAYRWVATHREGLGRFLSLALTVAIAGCGTTVQEGSELNVYLSAPLENVSGQDLADGAALALSRAGGQAGGVPVSLELLDLEQDGRSLQAVAAANAREASRDSAAIAYIGEGAHGGEIASVPITNDAGILQVAPFSVDDRLLREAPTDNDVPVEFQPSGERTFGALLVGGSVPAPSRAFEREFRREYDRRPGPAAAYGFEAMALILDSIDRAPDPLGRSSVVDAFLATADRESVLGTYSIGPAGIASLGR